LSEAWHFGCRGSHQKVYEYYQAGKASNFRPYTAMAASAIISAGIENDRLPNFALLLAELREAVSDGR